MNISFKMRKYWLFLPVLIWSFAAHAQNIVQGSVTDAETGDPLPGVNVYTVEKRTGTVSGQDGSFTLKVLKNPALIVFSYVGYETDSLLWQGENILEVHLHPNINLEEIVIMAIRADIDAPVAKTDLSRQNIKAIYVGQDVEFLLQNTVPSIVSYSESGTNFSNYGQFRLRGIDQSRINITLNGMPLNDMIDQGVFFSNFTDFSNNVQTIQVQRGVGTSTNGTASYAGSVNFESVNIMTDKPSAELELVGGSFGTYRASASVRTGLMKNKLSFYSRFSGFSSDGYRHHTTTKSYSFFASGGYFGKNDLIKFTGFTGRSKNGLAYLPVGIGDIQKDPKTNYVNENDIDDFGQWAFQLQHTHLFNRQWSLASTAYVSGAGGDFPVTFTTYDTLYQPGTPPYQIKERLVQINYPLTNKHYGLIANVNFTSRNEKWLAYGGLHMYTFRRNNYEEVMPDIAQPYYHEQSKKDEISFFGKAIYHIHRFKIYGDLQFRTLSMDITPDKNLLPDEPDVIKKWTFFNPRIGVDYKFHRTMGVYLSWGRNGREPTKIDILGGFQLNPSNLSSVKSNDVKPEFVDDIEGGFQIHSGVLQGQANLFYMFFKDEIAPIGEYVPEGFIQLRKNVPQSYRRGAEIDMKWKISRTFDLGGNATYMKSRIKEYAPEGDDQIYYNVIQPLSPEWMFSAKLTCHFLPGLSLTISEKYMSSSYLEPTNDPRFIMPSFFITNARLSYSFGNGHMIDIFVNNIFNARYYTYGAPVDMDWDGTYDQPGYFVQPPLNVFAKLFLKF